MPSAKSISQAKPLVRLTNVSAIGIQEDQNASFGPLSDPQSTLKRPPKMSKQKMGAHESIFFGKVPSAKFISNDQVQLQMDCHCDLLYPQRSFGCFRKCKKAQQ